MMHCFATARLPRRPTATVIRIILLVVQPEGAAAALDGMFSTMRDILNPAGKLQAHHRSLAIKVIGAGLGRTGTGSLHAALEILGFRTYHFAEMLKDMAHASTWGDLADGHATADQVIDMMLDSGFNASVDLPSSDLYAEQLKRFPDAKVILSVRDSGDQWANSWRTLMGVAAVMDRPFSLLFPSFLQWMPSMRALRKIRCWFGTGTIGLRKCALAYGYGEHPPEWLQEQYAAHNRRVRASVPAGSLLEFNVKEGWGPLCAFLSVPVPDRPFPRVNDSAFLNRAKMLLYIVCYSWIPCLFLLLYGVVRCCCICPAAKRKSA
ncbi:unnamed protein product [Prorocentrum cordatum]|uniref:Protein-tyrosine sulfotransferase n=1 Tax=Prorocentrum cordatum TaxID=2364126 RepID=A0ABN9VHE4_9DINO|nr:unnamed protein product [Polarella glacialis]